MDLWIHGCTSRASHPRALNQSMAIQLQRESHLSCLAQGLVLRILQVLQSMPGAGERPLAKLNGPTPMRWFYASGRGNLSPSSALPPRVFPNIRAKACFRTRVALPQSLQTVLMYQDGRRLSVLANGDWIESAALPLESLVSAWLSCGDQDIKSTKRRSPARLDRLNGSLIVLPRLNQYQYQDRIRASMVFCARSQMDGTVIQRLMPAMCLGPMQRHLGCPLM